MNIRPPKSEDVTLDETEYNRKAWDELASSHRKWFVPVSKEEIAEARNGLLKIKVTATKDVPTTWIGKVPESNVLCLASGGGHQGPLLAAAGAKVTVADFSDAQLAVDREVAERESLSLQTVQCDMRDLGNIGEFDLVLNPCSVNFCDDVRQVWREAFRVLRPGGVFITGVINPVNYLFDPKRMIEGQFVVANKIPWQEGICTDQDSQVAPTPVEYGHSLADLIGGQCAAGFQITDFFEDRWGSGDLLSERIAVFAATRAIKSAEKSSG